MENFNPNIDVLGSVVNGTKVTYTFRANPVENRDCYTACLSFWPCGFECERQGFCYEESLAYHYIINVCGCDDDDPSCDDHNFLDCVSTSCDCLKLCVDGMEVIFNNTTGGIGMMCFDDGSDISIVADCDEDIPCHGITKNVVSHTVPDVDVIQYNKVSDGLEVDLKLPGFVGPSSIIISDDQGKIVYQENLLDAYSNLRIQNLNSGIYFISVTNGTTRLQHKIMISD